MNRMSGIRAWIDIPSSEKLENSGVWSRHRVKFHFMVLFHCNNYDHIFHLAVNSSKQKPN